MGTLRPAEKKPILFVCFIQKLKQIYGTDTSFSPSTLPENIRWKINNSQRNIPQVFSRTAAQSSTVIDQV